MNRRWWEKTWLVAQREIRTRGRSRTYAVTTVILLLAIAAAVVIPAMISHTHKPERVGVAGGDVTSMTATVQEAARLGGTRVTVVPEPSVRAAEAGVRSGDLSAALVDGREVLIKQVPFGGPSGSAGSLPSVIARVAGLSRYLARVPPAALSGGLSLPVRGLVPPAASLTSRLTGQLATIVLFIVIQIYGQQIAMGVAEEKQSRIVEVILAAIRPIQLLAGKVIGIGLLALSQTAAMVAVFLGLGAAVGSSLVHGAAPGIVVAGAVFLVLGYAFYSTAFAAVGSLVSRQSELGTASVPVVIPLVLAYVLEFSVLYSNGVSVFYRVLGFLPPTSPVAMPVLYATGEVSLWQVVVSAVLLLAGTVGMARFAATIYSRSILRTGGRVRLRQVLRAG